MSFGERLRNTRRERGISQEMLAEQLDVSRQSVTKWETGISYPEIRTLIHLASLLNRDLDWLLYDEKLELVRPDQSDQNKLSEGGTMIPDRDTLNTIMKGDLLSAILKALNGYEIVRSIETAEFTGKQTIIFYSGRVLAEIDGITPDSGERIQSFAEMNRREIEALLLPWAKIKKVGIELQPEVAKMHFKDGGN